MFSTKENESLASLQSQLIEAKRRVALQQKSIENIQENFRRGGSGGFVPPHLSQAILESYQNEVKVLEARIQQFNAQQLLNDLRVQLTQAKNKVTEQEISMRTVENLRKQGGCGGIVPPYMSQAILSNYRNEVRTLEARIEQLEAELSQEEKKIQKI